MAKESINIRTARKEDYKFFNKIEESSLDLFKEHGCDFSHLPSTETDIYNSIEGQHEIYVATTDKNKIVGFCAIKIIDGNAYIMELSVLTEYRRKGIGTKLVNHAIYWADINNYDYITLTTFKNIPFNAPFYKKFGFEEFLPDAKWQGLKSIREHEKKCGVEILPRIAMRKFLK